MDRFLDGYGPFAQYPLLYSHRLSADSNDCQDISADYQEIPQSVARTSRTIPCQSTIDHDHAFIPHRIPAFFITPQAIHHGI